MKEIRYPNLRINLISFLESLSDKEYQQHVWIEGRRLDGVVHDEFDYSVHFLFDDTDLARDAKSDVGYILYDDEEAESISFLTQIIDRMLKKHGTKLSDADYMALPEWPMVIDAANAALKVIRSNERQNGKGL
jgi:hypothetical protein